MKNKPTYSYAYRTLTFIVIMLLINEGIKLYFENVSSANHKLVTQDAAFHAAPDTLDLLIMGHSRSYAAIDIDILNAEGIATANFSSGGESNIHSYYKLKYVLKESGKNVKTVIMPSGFTSFSLPDPDMNSNSFYWKRYVDYIALGKESNDFKRHLSVWIKAHMVPWYEYPYLRSSVALGDFNLTVNNKGFAAVNDSARTEMARGAIEGYMAVRQSYHEVSLLYLQRTIDLCKQYQVQLIYTDFPTSSYYQTVAREIIEENRITGDQSVYFGMVKADSIINTSNVVYWEDALLYSDNNAYFADSQHMNEVGRAAYTQLVKSRLLTN